MKTIVYIDGFNLYYGLLRGTNYKWLDLQKLFEDRFPDNNIIQVKYFTARLKCIEDRADSSTVGRQKAYLKALETLSKIEIIFGYFSVHRRKLKHANPPPDFVEVIKPEEKGSDVNLQCTF